MRSLFITILLSTASTLSAGPAPALDIDPNRVTVSGISAGGQMAHQLHIAYSDVFSGAGIIAGGPFGCANGSLATAMARCMGKVDGELPVAEFAEEIRSASTDGRIAAAEALADDPVWLFHGTLDTVVANEVADAVNALYTEFIPSGLVRYVNDIEAAHTFPTQGQGHACTDSQSPFVGDCNYDAAGEILNHLYPDLDGPALQPALEPAALTSVTLPGAEAAGLSDEAWLYIPAACSEAGKSCALHLVLHGCAQSALQLGTEFIELSGYLPWAEANGIVLAFPQVAPAPMNPYACWDWWGYTGPDYRWRTSPQMKAVTDWIRAM